jgi:hypothetical protein
MKRSQGLRLSKLPSTMRSSQVFIIRVIYMFWILIMQEDKCIPGIDFARSLAASASLTQVYTLLDKV